MDAGHERARSRLLVRVSSRSLRSFTRVREDDDLGASERRLVLDGTGGEIGRWIDAKLPGDAVERVARLHDVA
jgi:hypothetical protein